MIKKAILLAMLLLAVLCLVKGQENQFDSLEEEKGAELFTEEILKGGTKVGSNVKFHANLVKLIKYYAKLVKYVKKNDYLTQDSDGLREAVNNYLAMSVNDLDSLNGEISDVAWVSCVHKLHPRYYKQFLKSSGADHNDFDYIYNGCIRQRKFVHKIKLPKKCDEKSLKPWLKDYVDFLKLIKKNLKKILVPTLAQDFVWHSHMQDYENYRKDTKKIVGKFVDHEDDIEDGLLKKYAKDTKKAWKKHSKNPNYDIGGQCSVNDVANCGTCGTGNCGADAGGCATDRAEAGFCGAHDEESPTPGAAGCGGSAGCGASTGGNNNSGGCGSNSGSAGCGSNSGSAGCGSNSDSAGCGASGGDNGDSGSCGSNSGSAGCGASSGGNGDSGSCSASSGDNSDGGSCSASVGDNGSSGSCSASSGDNNSSSDNSSSNNAGSGCAAFGTCAACAAS